MLNKLYEWFKKPQHLIGASILRILFGGLVLYTYIVNYPLRQFFWGNDGIIDNQTYSDLNRIFFSVYGFTDSNLIFEVTYHVGILITFLFMIGFGGKAIQILNYIFTLSLFNRNGLISDGGDNLLYLCLFYMLFMNVTEHFSLKTNFWKRVSLFGRIRQKMKGQLAILHNFGVIFVIFQLCFMYLLSGLYQVMGERWNSGTAIYYILQVEQYSLNILPEFLTTNALFIVLATYGSVIIKIAFPFALFNKYTKYIVIFGIISFHLGILLEMGLITFSLIMISVDFLIFSDKEYRFARNKIVKISESIRNTNKQLIERKSG